MSFKSNVRDLAIFGGQPAFEDKVYVGRPNIGDRERLINRINGLLDRKWLTNNGPLVSEFERKIAEYIGVKHCVAMCNATIALEIAIRALGFSGEVIVPSFTFIATAHALQWQEITPIFCDVDPWTHNIDPDKVETMITPRTTGILGVHLWGQACEVERLDQIAERHNIKLLFDAAHAFGCSYKNRMIGNFGNAEVFSFHATKFFNTFEGGAVVTNDDELANRLRLMKNFGFAGYDHVVYIGTNGKMSEASAAMGLTSLESIDEFVSHNLNNYCKYKAEIAGINGISLYPYPEKGRHNYQYIVLEIDNSISQIGRDSLVDILWAENIIARRYFYPGCHRMEPYKSYFPHAGLLLPVTEALTKRILLLPTGLSIDEHDIEKICDVIKFCILNGKSISQKLEKSPAIMNYSVENPEQADEL